MEALATAGRVVHAPAGEVRHAHAPTHDRVHEAPPRDVVSSPQTAIRTVAYLGPEGTFTHQALTGYAPHVSALPTASVAAALGAVTVGEADAAMIPIENSVEGGVNATLDALATAEDMVIVGEHLLPVTFVLAVRPGTRLSEITRVGTHSHAWAQVRRFCHTRLPKAAYVPAPSTAAAAAMLSAGDAPFDAVVCAPMAAGRHGLRVLADNIGDMGAAVTRFVMVAPKTAMPAPTGADKSTIVLHQREDRAGGLLELLGQFASRGINMTRLESRPTGSGMGSYCFSIDFEGHLHEERVGEALMALHRLSAGVHFLGSYPRADGRTSPVGSEDADPSFVNARSWLRSLRQRLR